MHAYVRGLPIPPTYRAVAEESYETSETGEQLAFLGAFAFVSNLLGNLLKC